MRTISDTIARLQAAAGGMGGVAPDATRARLSELTGFGPNPGALRGWSHVPKGEAAMPMVVVLHGCTQTAAGYDTGSGWSELADRFGFALLFPEQQRANNPNACFNWFQPEDVDRDSGEIGSIRAMIATMLERHPIDPARVFVTGLSAGGAMASALLARAPGLFAGGAIVAGLPYGAANSVQQAFDRMRGHGHADDAAAAAAIRAASSHRGPWPAIGVWHGSADRTVAAINADRIVGQWRALQDLPATPDENRTVGGHRRRVWRGRDGRPRIEDHRIEGMGHGTPLATAGDTACGHPTAYMLDVGVSSTWHIADSWGLLGAERIGIARPIREAAAAPGGVQQTMEAALRSTGLMR